MLQIIFHIARNTFRECIRQPIYCILTLTCASVIGLYPSMALFVFREQEKLVMDGALATSMVFGWIIAVLLASHVVNREIETGTVLLVLSKPVNRPVFLLAKLLGIFAALTPFMWVSGICCLVSLRIAVDQFRLSWPLMILFFGGLLVSCLYGAWANYLRKESFPAATITALVVVFTVLGVAIYLLPLYEEGTGFQWGKHVGYNWNLLRAVILVFFAVLAMGTLATALSTGLDLVSNLSICAVVFVVGLVSDYCYGGLLKLTTEDVAYLLHDWFVPLLPLVLVFWLFSTMHFPARRRSALKLWELHLAFGALTALLVARLLVNVVGDVRLREPTPFMRSVAAPLYSLKNAFADLLHALIPNWQLLWNADPLAAKTTIPAVYLGWGLAYTALFSFTLLLLALLAFTGREVGQQTSQR